MLSPLANLIGMGSSSSASNYSGPGKGTNVYKVTDKSPWYCYPLAGLVTKKTNEYGWYLAEEYFERSFGCLHQLFTAANDDAVNYSISDVWGNMDYNAYDDAQNFLEEEVKNKYFSSTELDPGDEVNSQFFHRILRSNNFFFQLYTQHPELFQNQNHTAQLVEYLNYRSALFLQ